MTDTVNVPRERLEDVKAELYCSTEAFTQSLAFGRMRLVSYDQCWASKQATTLLLSLLCARPAPASDELLEALEKLTSSISCVEINGPKDRAWGMGSNLPKHYDAAIALIAKHKGPQS